MLGRGGGGGLRVEEVGLARMSSEDARCGRKPRTWLGFAHRYATLKDRTLVRMVAYQRGIRPSTKEAAWGFAPGILVLLRFAYHYARYRTTYKGAWTVDIRDQTTDETLVEREFPNRKTALKAFESALAELPNLTSAEVGKALGLETGEAGGGV